MAVMLGDMDRDVRFLSVRHAAQPDHCTLGNQESLLRRLQSNTSYFERPGFAHPRQVDDTLPCRPRAGRARPEAKLHFPLALRQEKRYTFLVEEKGEAYGERTDRSAAGDAGPADP